MRKILRHIFSWLLALHVIAASAGAAFYKHYCNVEGELMAVSAYAETGGTCCNTHNHEGKHDKSHGDHEGDCCDLQYEFRRAETAPVAESLKLAVPSLAFALHERSFNIPLSVFQAIRFDIRSFTDDCSSTRYYVGKALLPFIQQFRL